MIVGGSRSGRERTKLPGLVLELGHLQPKPKGKAVIEVAD